MSLKPKIRDHTAEAGRLALKEFCPMGGGPIQGNHRGCTVTARDDTPNRGKGRGIPSPVHFYVNAGYPGDTGSIPGLGRSPEEKNGKPSCILT